MTGRLCTVSGIALDDGRRVFADTDDLTVDPRHIRGEIRPDRLSTCGSVLLWGSGWVSVVVGNWTRSDAFARQCFDYTRDVLCGELFGTSAAPAGRLPR